MKKFLFLVVFVSFIIAGNLTATNYTVSSASDIAGAMNNAAPGDTLFMTEGVWKDQQIRFVANGTEEAPIVLKAEKEGRVFITGNSYLRIGGSYLVVDGLNFIDGYTTNSSVIEFRNGSSNEARHCRLTNTAVINYNASSISTDYKWISLYGQYNRVDHCYLAGKSHSGTTLVVWLDSTPDYHLIDSNYFGARPDLGFNGGETIRIGTSDWSMHDSYTTVEHNLFENCDGETEIISNKSGHNVYRYNTFYECKGTLTLRHGNDCEVYGNFFFGNDVSSTGGIRIIGENHKVYNNYLENLDGDGYRAAICMVLGVQNSPLNRYFQVKNAEVVNNTIVNCDQGFAIGYGSSSDQTLPPMNSTIANNVVQQSGPIFRIYEEPINMTYSKNMVYGGNIGISPVPAGVSEINPMLVSNGGSIYRPDNGSPVIDYADQSFNYITHDIDGQTRNIIDAGADEVSTDPVLITPVDGDIVGVRWEEIPPLPPMIRYVQAGTDSLLNAVSSADDGMILELITNGGNYVNTSAIEIDKDITIRPASSVEERPVITNSGSGSERSLFIIKNGGDLALRGLDLDGESSAGYIITTDTEAFSYEYRLNVNDCILHDVQGSFLRAYPGTLAEKVVFENSVFYNSAQAGIRMDEEAAGSSNYNAKYLYLTNSTFYNIPNSAVSIYGGDNVPFTPSTKLIADHCTFYNCGTNSAMTLYLDQADSCVVKNSIISNSSVGGTVLELYGLGSEIEYTTIHNSGSYELYRNAKEGYKVFDYDPMFADASAGNFTLTASSPVLLRGMGKTAMGDKRWGGTSPDKYPLDILLDGPGTVDVNPVAEYSLYTAASSVQITANPAPENAFTGFSGDVNATDNPFNVTMLGAMEITASFRLISGVDDESTIPQGFSLYQNYPNPFNPSTKIRFDLPEQSGVRMNVYNALGELVQEILSETMNAGTYEVTFNAHNLTSGIYFVELVANNHRSVIKVNLLR